ncbi:NADH-ubiquinone oxidoreductase-F iron-sulfur binding region domain-containing protein [Aliikangiella coralliicola]|uniref:NADH-quinone oxidoreductase subunit F n=1 Tax=Aliikangiella coralliicola TaxID=2592383 RepID=A0A545UF89_9GAMM|nr:NADH-ubiquinone oxidoreductase-F iron-sulfur binding region domain-containing protein [Aliikangiella coralliicola]TQV88146.1 formate dehydrogenase [Aliikangiella coralliicola]
MSENLSSLSRRKGLKDNLFETLVQAKGDPVHLKKIARDFKIGESSVYGASTAYDFILGENADKKAYLCNGSSCLCAETQDKVKHRLLAHFDSDEIGHVTCLGRCHENASFQINGNNYSGEDIHRLDNILEGAQDSGENYLVECALEKPLLTEEINDYSGYYHLFSRLTSEKNQSQILQEIIDSGLRGRGGAGFPTGIKWQSCANENSDQKYIVCNADEGDPGAFSDRYLLEQRPHAVLFGMLVAGYLAGAQWGVLYIRDEYPLSVSETQKAIEEFESLDLLAEIDFDFQFKIIRGAGAYICGEETALLRSIEGNRPVVSVRPPFPTVKGLFGKPTILNNVETFAAIHWILENSAQAFAALGNGRSTGSKLLSLDSCFNRPGIYEVAMSEKLSTIIDLAGGFSKPVKALHIGGPLGGLVPVEKINELTIDFESFQEQGFLLGHASIIGIPESQNIAEYIYHLFDFTAAESCGKCFPCRLGATRGKEMFRDALKGEIQLDKQLLDDLLETMEKGSLCALGGGVPLPVKNALQYFLPEMETLFEPQSLNRIDVVEA